MKKRLLFICLALALVMTTLVSTTTFAAGWTIPNKTTNQRFTVVMTPTQIDAPVISGVPWPGANPAGSNSWPIYDLVSGKPTIVGWIVASRSVYGGVSGDLAGVGTFTYGGILDTMQSGSMQGVLVINTGGVDSLYLAASGSLAATVTEYYDFPGIATWCQGKGPVGVVLAGIYNAPMLALLPDGGLAFADLQAWCAAINLTTGQFYAGITGNADLALLPDEAILSMYGNPLPILTGLQILGGMYGNTLPSLPKTMSAQFSGTLRVDAGTGTYSGASGQGQFGPYNKTGLTLHVSPIQHVESVEGAIQISGTYIKKVVEPRKPHFDKISDAIKQWKDRFGQGNGFDKDKISDAIKQWKDRFGKK